MDFNRSSITTSQQPEGEQPFLLEIQYTSVDRWDVKRQRHNFQYSESKRVLEIRLRDAIIFVEVEALVSRSVFEPYLSNRCHKASSAKSAILLQHEHRDGSAKRRSTFSRIRGKSITIE